MTATPIVTSVDIGQAERAARRLLDALLDREGVSFDEWVALRLLGGNDANVDEFVPAFAALLAGDDKRAPAFIDACVAKGLIERNADASARIAPTARGNAIYERISADAATVAKRLYDGIAVEDLQATYRVLHEVVERANTLHAEGMQSIAG